MTYVGYLLMQIGAVLAGIGIAKKMRAWILWGLATFFAGVVFSFYHFSFL